VEIFRFGDPGECAAFLVDALRDLEREEPLASVGLLTRSPEIADVYARALDRAGLPRVHRVADQDFRFAPGIEVCDVAQAKGLEFDYVVLLDVSAAAYPDTPAARRLLHVGMTRATWQLWVCCVGAPSPLLPAS
jgi:DNA helicase-2/ATP-dependent DNA helicase PcrA